MKNLLSVCECIHLKGALLILYVIANILTVEHFHDSLYIYMASKMTSDDPHALVFLPLCTPLPLSGV